MSALKTGEVAFHDDQGLSIHLTREGIVINGAGKPLAFVDCPKVTMDGDLEVAGEVRDRHVLIAGAGMLGIIACAMSRSAGAKCVTAVDIDEARLTTAREFGVDHTVNLATVGKSLNEAVADLKTGEPVTVALDFSGVPETVLSLFAQA